MANEWVTDQKWRDIKHQDLPGWVKRRVKALDHQSLTGKSFEYRREPTTGRYQRRLRCTPVNTIKQHRDGIALGKLEKHEQAIACFDEAIRINEMDHTAYHRKGVELNALGKYNKAMECFERAIQINSNDRFAWNHRGVSLRELERYDEALRSCNEAIKINDKYAFAWYTKGSILHHLGNVTEARICFQRTLKLVPGNDMYKKRLSGINELIGQSKTENQTVSQLLREGLVLSKLGKHEEALDKFEKLASAGGG